MGHRLRKKQPRLQSNQQLLQRRQVRPVGQARHAHNAGSRKLELAEQEVVAWVVDQHRAAGWHKVANHQIQRFVGTLCQHDLPRFGANAEIGKLAYQMIAQWGVAESRAIAKQCA